MKFIGFICALAASTQVEAFSPSTIYTSKSVARVGSKWIASPPITHHDYHSLSTSNKKALSKLFMGWGPEPIWSSCSVISNEPASSSGNFVSVTMNVPSELVEEYRIPGQYVQVKPADNDEAKPLFLAIASAPIKEGETGNSVEFLIKKTENNDWITNSSSGAAFAISQVMGKGFPIAENCDGFKYDFPVQNCLLFANGSGIAPIRAAMESGQLKIAKPGEGGRTARLYYGCATIEDMPYLSKFGDWEANGFEVVPVISRPEECKWEGRTGYIQTAAEEDGIAIPRNTAALLCGVKGMAESVKDLLSKAGVFEGRVMTNF